MKRRIALALVTVLACGMVLTGCGNKEEGGQAQTGESVEETETPAENDSNEEETEAEAPAENDTDNAEGPVIGLSMHCSSSFFDGVISGVEKYVEENGGRIINVDGRYVLTAYGAAELMEVFKNNALAALDGAQVMTETPIA